MRLLVTGGREYSHRTVVHGVLDLLHAERPIVTLIHGGCGNVEPYKGADGHAHTWAVERDVAIEIYLADWQKYGLAAGTQRNGVMLRDGRPNLVLAFPGRGGTADCVAQALALKIPVTTVYRGLVLDTAWARAVRDTTKKGG